MHPVPVDCVLGNYVNTGDCSKTCGGGLQEQAKQVLVATDFDGKECDTELNRLVSCNEQACPVDCVVSKWTNDGVCDKVRTRDVRRVRWVRKLTTVTWYGPERLDCARCV